MLLALLAGAQPPQSYGAPLVVLAIAVIGGFSIVGFFEPRALKYYVWHCVVQFGYFILDYGTATLTGKSTWFAAVQLVNFTIAGALFGLAYALYARATKALKVTDFGGMYPASQLLGVALIVSCLSLGGLPGFNIFVGEYMMYSALMDVVPLFAILAIAASLICFLFYFRLVYVIFAGQAEERINLGFGGKLVAASLTAAVIGLGVIPQILFKLMEGVL